MSAAQQYQLFDPLREEEFAALKADIAKRGVMVPVLKDEHGNILDGHHRVQAWTELRAEGVNVPDYPRAIMGQMSEREKRMLIRGLNLQRRHLTSAQKRKVLTDELREDPARSNREIARVLGVDHKTVESVRSELQSTGEIPQLERTIGADGKSRPATKPTPLPKPAPFVRAKDDREERRAMAVVQTLGEFPPGSQLDLKEVSQREKRIKRDRQVEAIAAEPPALPTGPFRVIVADPPWAYDNRAEDPTHRAANPYPSMDLDAIKALDVASLAHDDAVLWLWTTNAHLPESFGVLTAWGFTYKTTLTWAKDRMGTGDWLRGQTEHCLLAVRGRPVVKLTNQTTLLHGPLREHSRKPDEFYDLVNALCPGAKVELFSRREREGWVGYGDELPRPA